MTNLWQQDPAIFDVLYRENAPRLRAFLQQITGSSQTAEDLTQDIFTQFWSRPSTFDFQRGSFRAYLFGIGRHRAAEWWRGQRPHDPLSEDSFSVINHERQSLLVDALAHLPQDQRLLLWLREVEGQSYAELATIFEIPVGTVRSRLFMARQAFQHIWLDQPTTAGSKGIMHEVR